MLHTLTIHTIRRKRQWAGRLDRATKLKTERALEHKAVAHKATLPRLLWLQRLARTALSSPLLSTCRLVVGTMGDRKNCGRGQPALTLHAQCQTFAHSPLCMWRNSRVNPDSPDLMKRRNHLVGENQLCHTNTKHTDTINKHYQKTPTPYPPLKPPDSLENEVG